MTNECRMCRKQFEATRTATTCSDRCRKRYQRLKDHVKTDLMNTGASVTQGSHT
jgi:hypothetical protein